MPAASSGLREENKGRNDASCCWRVNHDTPLASSRPQIRMLQRCLTERDLYSFFSWSILGRGSIAHRQSDLHLHYFLIGRDHFVSDLQEHFKFQLRALRRESDGVQFVGAAGKKAV